MGRRKKMCIEIKKKLDGKIRRYQVETTTGTYEVQANSYDFYPERKTAYFEICFTPEETINVGTFSEVKNIILKDDLTHELAPYMKLPSIIQEKDPIKTPKKRVG